MTSNEHKRGDTFDYSDQLAMTIDGVPVTDFTGMVGASQIRTMDGVLVAVLAFTWLDAAQGLFRLRQTGPIRWPAAPGSGSVTVKHDIQLTTPGGDVVSTATETFRLVEDVTHG